MSEVPLYASSAETGRRRNRRIQAGAELREAIRGGFPGYVWEKWVLGAICGFESSKIDKISWKLTFKIPPRRPCVDR